MIAVLRLFIPEHPPASSDDFRSILIIRQHNQLGDMLCVVPLLRALRSAYPHAGLVLMTSSVNHEVMEGNRYLDGTILYDKREFLGRWTLHVGALLRFVKRLRSREFDAVIVPTTVSMSFTSDLLAFLSGAGTRIGAAQLNGIPNPSGFVYTEKVALDWRSDPRRHQTRRNLDIVGARGIETDDLACEITLSDEEKEEGRGVLAALHRQRPLVLALHPGAGKLANRWPAERFATVANALSKRWNASVVITCGPMDEEPVKEMVSGLDCLYQVIRNEPIRRVASILSDVDLLISNDTGIMHVGAAVGAPTLSLFGPTDCLQWAPLGEQNQWLSAQHGDIAEITVDDVLCSAGAMLQKRKSRR